MTARDLAPYIDHTLLKPGATEAEIDGLCNEAIEYGFASVCINPYWVKQSAARLQGSNVKVCTVIGFPLGATITSAKVEEVRQVVSHGASEVDMVINIGALKSGWHDVVLADIESVVAAARNGGALTKVIIETALLTDPEKITASLLARRAGADFVKTSTGFGGGGATTTDVALMRGAVGPDMGVKASGGVRTLKDTREMISAGATRIGSSSGIEIVESEDSGSEL